MTTATEAVHDLRAAEPWLAQLPPEQLAEARSELDADLVSGRAAGDFVQFDNDMAAWKSTVEILADPALVERLTADLAGDARPVPRPTAP